MFNTVGTPNASAQYAELVEPGRYLAKLVRLEDMGESTYPNPERKPTDPIPHRIKWVFNLADPTAKTPLVNPDGSTFELFAWTSNATGPKSSARPLFEALLKRPLAPGDGENLSTETIGKVAWAMVDQIVVDDGMGGTKNRLKILNLSPFVAGQKPGAAPMPQAAAVPVQADMDAARRAAPAATAVAEATDEVPW